MATPQSVPHSTEGGVWRDRHGVVVPDTESRKSAKGFAGWLLVTPDQDWQQKWETPREVTPQFNQTDTVGPGGHVYVLIFFANPARSDAGTIDIRCDIEVERPNGAYSIQQRDLECDSGPLEGPTQHVFLSGPVLAFVGEPSDPKGQWVVRVMLKDKVRGVSVPLKTTFRLG